MKPFFKKTIFFLLIPFFLLDFSHLDLHADSLSENENKSSADATIQNENNPITNQSPDSDVEASVPAVTKNKNESFEDQIKQKKYLNQLKDGITKVFNYENNKNINKLGQIALTHPIPRVRVAAILAMGRLGKGSRFMMLAIDQDGEIVRQSAYEALASIGSQSALKYFIKGTKIDDLKIKIASFEGIGKTKDPVGRELILEEGIKSTNIPIVCASIRGLGWYNKIEDLDTISTFLKNENSEIYQAALDALANHKSIQSLFILEEEYAKNPTNAKNVIQSISTKKNIQSTLVLIKIMLKADSEGIKSSIAQLLNSQKRYGKFVYITSNKSILYSKPNERSTVIKELENMDIGVFIKTSSLRYIVKRDSTYQENNYHLVDFPYLSQEKKAFRGWVFGNDVTILNVQKPTAKKRN